MSHTYYGHGVLSDYLVSLEARPTRYLKLLQYFSSQTTCFNDPWPIGANGSCETSCEALRHWAALRLIAHVFV